LRRFFETDAQNVAVAVLGQLAKIGSVEPGIVAEAIVRFGLDPDAEPSWMR